MLRLYKISYSKNMKLSHPCQNLNGANVSRLTKSDCINILGAVLLTGSIFKTAFS